MSQPEQQDTPEIACSLDVEGQLGRARAFAELRPLAVTRVEGGLAARYPAGDEPAVTAFADAERACCPFLDIAVECDGDAVELRITGPADARPIIDAFLSLPG